MSYGTSDDDNTPYRNPDVDDTDGEEELWAEEGGFDVGNIWVDEHAGNLEKRSIWAAITGRRPQPQFSNCVSADEAIHELVRTIHPPCSLHWDSARAYWELIGEIMDSRAFVEGFFEGACAAVEELVSESVFYSAQRWVNERYRDEALEPAQRFAEQHDNTWQDVYPQGCRSFFEVALYMAGRLDSVRADDAVYAFVSEFRLYEFFAADTEEFARMLIVDIVNRLPRRRPQLGACTSDQQESQVEGTPAGGSSSSTLPHRQLRGIRLG